MPLDEDEVLLSSLERLREDESSEPERPDDELDEPDEPDELDESLDELDELPPDDLPEDPEELPLLDELPLFDDEPLLEDPLFDEPDELPLFLASTITSAGAADSSGGSEIRGVGSAMAEALAIETRAARTAGMRWVREVFMGFSV